MECKISFRQIQEFTCRKYKVFCKYFGVKAWGLCYMHGTPYTEYFKHSKYKSMHGAKTFPENRN